MTLPDAAQIIGMLGGGVLLVVTCSKIILAAGKLIKGLEQLTTFCGRLEQKFDASQDEFRRSNEDARDRFANHDTRLEKVEYVLDLDGHAQSMVRESMRQRGRKDQRRQDGRRTHDHVNQDVRAIVARDPSEEP